MSLPQSITWLAQTVPPLPPAPDDVREAITTATTQGANLGIWGVFGSIVLLFFGACMGLAFFGALGNAGIGTARMGVGASSSAQMAKGKKTITSSAVIMGVIAALAIIGGIALAFLTYFGV